MTNPFDAAIDTLRATMEGDWMMNDDYYVIPRVKSLEAAIRILEAAGKVDKERAVKYMSNIGVGAYETDGESQFCPPDKQAVAIRALLAALPEVTK